MYRSPLLRSSLILLFVAPAVQPPPIRHAHSGGDQPHQHIAASEHTHPLHRGHAHSEADHSVAPADDAQLPQVHRHYSFFGFDLALPDRADGEHDADHFSFVCALVGPAADGKAPVTDSWPAALPEPLGDSPDRLDAPGDGRPAHLAPQRALPAGPLCDTARHARSGVQLA